MTSTFRLFCAATAAFGLLCAPASSQGTEQAAGNVNDCTLIQDPTELRNCILRFEGQRTPPPVTLESGTEAGGRPVPAGDGTPTADGTTAAPKVDKRHPIKLHAAPPDKRRTRDSEAPSKLPLSSQAKGQEIWVEQIKIPNKK
jgi:hypothetical protein